ncbi:hemerythrin domain-containing protein [Altererythrobacter aurantiacus]|uniref:Hemerythrin domain-containing protein n=1 Tax=Parapontixanthobacter aurantiacus TaxID=1463599 RepID=A0A844ZBA8_9SPHN|nr:hemerythrin domain-containing protein [Parapontixanthobacter aurantiacus]MXO85821.1 hemerythrin domain-containing protein [Parapontixanthobacter aurantiacus]
MANDQDIFARLKRDHEDHRELLDKMADTTGESEERKKLLEQFTKEVKSHAAAEEQALYSTMLRKPPTTDETRHSVAEHHELNEALNDLAATDMSSSDWMTKFKQLDHDYRHHINEEEEDHFPDFEKYLTDDDRDHMQSVFDRRKEEEMAEAEVTPEKKEDAKE